MVDMLDDPEIKSELNTRIANLNDIKERATKLLDDKNALLRFLKRNRISGCETRHSYDNMYVSQLKELKNIRSPKRTPILFYSFRDS